MKILIAPAHYTINNTQGSEYTRAYEYIHELALDKSIQGDVLVGYCSEKEIGNLKIHSLWKKFPKNMNIFLKLQFSLWVLFSGHKLDNREHYDCIWHLGPFSIGETFNLLALTIRRNKHFVIGPIYTPFLPYKVRQRFLRDNGKTESDKIRHYLEPGMLLSPLSIATLLRANHVLAIESSGQDLLKKIRIHNTRVLPLGIKSEMFFNKPRTNVSKHINLFTASYLVKRKRVDDIIRSMATLVNDYQFTQFTLTIVGEGSEKKSLEKLSISLNLQDKIIFVGFVPHEQIHKYFRDADLFISATEADSMPGVYFEAMASGLPMVLSEIHSAQELSKIGLGAKLFPVGNYQLLAKSIMSLLDSPKEYSKYSKDNLHLMRENLNLSKNINKLKKLLTINGSRDIDTKKSRNKLASRIMIIVITIFSFIVITASVRGIYGNPSDVELNTSKWKENGPFELSPERGRFALTSTFAESGNVHFKPDLARFVSPDLGFAKGNYVSLFAPTLSFLVLPGYYLGKHFNADQTGIFFNIGIFAMFNLFLIFRIVFRTTGSKLGGIIAGLIFLFATPAYAYAVSLYQHHVSTTILLLGIILSLGRASLLRIFTIFLLWATSATLDYPNAFLFLPIAIFGIGNSFKSSLSASILTISLQTRYLLAVFGVVIPIILFGLFNNASYGSPLYMLGSNHIQSVNDVDPQGKPIFVNMTQERTIESIKAELESRDSKTQTSYFKTRELINGLYILISSPDRGVIYFTPVILLGIFGASIVFKKKAKIALLTTSIIVVNVLLYSMWGDPWGGWAFGGRYLIPAYAMLAIFLGAFLSHFRKNILVLLVFLVLGSYSIYVNTAGALSTSANPPQVQVLELEKVSGRQEKYSYDRNLDFLKYNTSKSFVYQTWVKNYVSSWQYFEIIAGSIITVLVITTIALYFSKEDNS